MGVLDGKVVIITGVGAGLGKQMSRRLAQEGARVSVSDLSEERAEATAALIREEGGDVLSTGCDVSKPSDLERMVRATVNRFGTIDVLINNANFEAIHEPFLEQDESWLTNALHVGVYAHWRLMKLCHPYMKGKASSIINFTSGVATAGGSFFAPFAADKAAIRALSMVVAREWGADGIRVNNVSPVALTDTIQDKLTPEFSEWAKQEMRKNALQHVGDPYDDIAPVVVFLASDASHYMTGQNFNVDGGEIIHF